MTKSIEGISAHEDSMKTIIGGMPKIAKAQVAAIVELESTIRSYTQNAFGKSTAAPEFNLDEEMRIRQAMSEGSTRREAEMDVQIGRAGKNDDYDFEVQH
jgi:hypothetical protein